MAEESIVIIGGVAAGMSAASKAKRVDPEIGITVYEKSRFVSYGSCGLPYFISGIVKDYRSLIARTPEEFASQGIEVRTEHEVTSIDLFKREVEVTDLKGGTTFRKGYDVLVIATGSRPSMPDVKGINLPNIFTMGHLDDGLALKSFLDAKRPRRAVIVGGGYIGLEMAEALVENGLAVTLVEKAPQLLLNFDPDMAEFVRGELERKGVEVVTGNGVTSFDGDRNGVRYVLTESGDRFECDLVLMATGIRPNVSLAEAAGIEIGRTGAIAVDERMLTDRHSIYAAGDCAEAKHLVTMKKVYIPLGTTANKQGRVAGENLAGGNARFKGVVGTAVTKVFDLGAARTGITEKESETLGFRAESVSIKAMDRSSYYVSPLPIHVKLIFEKGNGRLLGGQMVGAGEVAKRIDILAAALHAGMTVEDLSRLDLSYAPPFAPVWDPVLVAANVALKS